MFRIIAVLTYSFYLDNYNQYNSTNTTPPTPHNQHHTTNATQSKQYNQDRTTNTTQSKQHHDISYLFQIYFNKLYISQTEILLFWYILGILYTHLDLKRIETIFLRIDNIYLTEIAGSEFQ